MSKIQKEYVLCFVFLNLFQYKFRQAQIIWIETFQLFNIVESDIWSIEDAESGFFPGDPSTSKEDK